MMTVEAIDLLNIATDVLTQMGIDKFSDVKLAYANKKGNEWLVSFSFSQEDSWFRKTASFAVKSETGEIRGWWLDRVWK